MTLPAELAVMLGRLERELRAGAVSAESEAWLAQCGLTAEQMAAQMEAEYIPERKLHLYHCDHRGLPQALISRKGKRRGAGSMTNGETCWAKPVRSTFNSHSVCRGSSMMRSRGCTITGTGTTIRCRDAISPRSHWAEGGMEPVCVSAEPGAAGGSSWVVW